MKFIKLLVTMAIINMVLVVGMIQIGFPKKVIQPSAQKVEQDFNYQSGFGQIEPLKPSEVPTIMPTTTANPSKAPVNTATPKPSVATSTPTPKPSPSGCIVTLDSVKYDVTSLRRTHSGGDIFVCGSDMSQEFWSQHNQRIWQRMQQYRIN